MSTFLNGRILRNLLLIVAAMIVVMAAVWLLRDPLRSALATADDVRAWLVALGPLAPGGYFLFYTVQIVFAPLRGVFSRSLAATCSASGGGCCSAWARWPSASRLRSTSRGALAAA